MALAQRNFADDSSQPSEKEQFDPSGGVFPLFLMLLVLLFTELHLLHGFI
jgi:hypothetical protein